MISTTMYQEAGRAGGDRVGAAIRAASARTGVDFRYLFNQARIESSLDPDARARTSSATGLYQFIDQTWLATVSKHGAAHGLGWAADAIRQSGDGRYHVSDPAMRRAVLDLRRQPEAAAAMAAEFASDNRAHLESRLGRPVEPVDLYLAHFLGAAGAASFLRAHDANPDAPAARLLPAAARANRAIFYDRAGGSRSFAEIRERFAARIGNGSTAPTTPFAPPDETMTMRIAALNGETDSEGAADILLSRDSLVRPSPHRARLAYLMLAGLGVS
jgi:hypothetical protein